MGNGRAHLSLVSVGKAVDKQQDISAHPCLARPATRCLRNKQARADGTPGALNAARPPKRRVCSVANCAKLRNNSLAADAIGQGRVVHAAGVRDRIPGLRGATLPDQELHLQTPGGVHGLEMCLARRIDECHLDVQLVGAPAYIRQVAMRMLRGPIEAEFEGRALRLTRFTVFNQADRTRLVFIAEHLLP